MSFLDDDEYLLFMDCPQRDGSRVTDREMAQLRAAGMRTAYNAYTSFDDFVHKGVEDWGYFDRYIERCDRAGMKCIIQLWQRETEVGPRQWYVSKSSGVTRALSPWSQEAQEYNRGYIAEIIQRYASDRVMFVTGQHQGNERVLRNSPAYYDDNALADWRLTHEGRPDHRTPEGAKWLRQAYVDLMVDIARLFLAQPNREIWYNLSRAKAQMANLSCHGCEWIDDYLVEWHKLKPSSINHISFNFFPYGRHYWELILQKNCEFGVNEFVGAEYCEGLRDGNGDKAAEMGLRGMIIGPTHEFAGHKSIEPWMLHEIERAHNRFAARQI